MTTDTTEAIRRAYRDWEGTTLHAQDPHWQPMAVAQEAAALAALHWALEARRGEVLGLLYREGALHDRRSVDQECSYP